MRRLEAILLATTLSVGMACGDDDEPAAPPVAPGSGAAGPAATADPEAPIEPQVCTGANHTCAMKPSGEVFCAGANLEGELGDGTTQDRWTWTPVAGLNDARDIECGSDHTCALRRNGEVSCWGRNRHGELGAGNTDVQIAPVAVSGLTGVAELSAGEDVTCARLSDASVRCWGKGSRILGRDSSDDSPVPLAIDGLSGVVEITVGSGHACARKNDGSVWCWGRNNSDQLGSALGGRPFSAEPVQIAGLSGATHVAAGGNHTCAVIPEGVACWGANSNAQSSGGAATDDNVVEPRTVARLEGTQRLALGVKRTCALLRSGGVKCFGYNNYTAGLLGIGPTQGVRDAVDPTDVPEVAGAQRIDTSNEHSCVVDGEGGVTCWGAGLHGRMGNGSPSSLQTAEEVIASIEALTGEASALPTFEPADGDLTVSPHLAVGTDHVCGVKLDGHVYCFGEGGYGRLGNGSERANASEGGVDVVGISDAVQVTAGLRQSCALRRNGTVACWGMLTGDRRSSHPLPVDLGDPVKQISVGGPVAGAVLCGVHQDGTVSCLGYNSSGNLGRGSRGSTETVAARIEGLTDVEEVRVGVSSACARQSSGKVFCWGDGRDGQLGNGAEDSSTSPVEVSGLRDAIALGGGGYDYCAVRRNGAYVCWGSNDDGQLGNGKAGDDEASSTPTAVRGVSGVLAASDTWSSMCVATRSGPRCWGANDFGQTGTGDAETDEVTHPVTYSTEDQAVSALGDVVRMGCGSNYCCALHASGGVSCAGSTPIGGSGGLLGMSNRRSATPIAAPGVTYVATVPGV